MRTVDQEALQIAKNDAKFLAKITGLSLPRAAAQSPTARAVSPAPADATVKVEKQAAKNPHGLGYRQLSSAPTSSFTSKQPGRAASAKHTAVPADCSAGPDRILQEELSASAPCTPASTSLAADTQQRQHPQQQKPRSPHDSSRAARESPHWLVHTATLGATSATRAVHGPMHAESSLYSAWAESHSNPRAEAAAPRSNTAAPALSRSQAPSPVPAAPGLLQRRATDQAASFIPAPADACAASAVRCGSPLRQPLPVTGAAAAACTAAVAAAALPGSPCSSNYHSTRAAGIAAGISRAGAISPEHQQWFRQQHPKAQPPRREDTQQLWQWLADELQQLKQQLQQPQAQQKELQQCLAGPATQEQLTNAVHPPAQQPCSNRQGAASPTANTLPAAALAVGTNADRQQSSSSRAGSPGRRSPARDRSPGRQQAPDGLTAAAAGLEQQVQQLAAMCRGVDGTLRDECVQLQLDLFSSAFGEVCRQVSVGCVERGALMAQLWSAHTLLLQAAMQDRHVAQQQTAAAEQATAAAVREQQRLAQLQEDEKVALRAISQRHAAKAEAAKQDYDQLKMQNEKLQELLKRLSGAQQLVQRVLDLEASSQQQEFSIQQLKAQLDDKQQQLEAASAQVIHWMGRAQTAEGTVAAQQQQLGVSTPRPRRDLGLVCDLVEPQQQQLIEQALVGGVPAAHVHRLLLGLSTSGRDMRPLLQVAGSCVAALQNSPDPGQLYQLLRQNLTDCNAAGLAKHLSDPEHLQLLSQAVHVGTDTDTLLSILDGSLGLPSSSNNITSSCSSQKPAPARRSLQSTSSISATAAKAAPAAGAAAAATAAAGAVSNVGAGLMLLPLVGVLASKYGHDARELGGPVTEALVQAQLSTVSRVQELEARCRALHKEVVMLKCTLAEQRKHEQERVEAALRDQKRKIARREARQPTLLERFLQTKWGTLFTGIGMSDNLPRILRANAPVNNKQMPKREAERLASEIWAFKDQQDAVSDVPITLEDATAVFLERRFFAIPRLVTEVAYNLIYSLGQHTYDTDCNLFLRVFSGEVDESVRHEQQLLEGEIMRMLKLLDVSINHQATGWLHKADVKTALAGFFKGKKVDRLAEILEALDTDEPGDALHYVRLFSDDDDLNQGLTAEIIRSQHLTERLEYLQEIEDYIRDAAEDNGTTSLTPAMLEGCLRKAHKQRLDSAGVSEYVSRAFGPNWDEQKHRLAQPLGAIIRAVRCGGLPNMLRPAAGPSTVAGAVTRIVPVGKFKNKLVSALKVGFSKDAAPPAPAAGTAARRVSRGHMPAAADGGAQKVKSRRATQEAVSAAISAVLSGDGSKSKQHAKGARSAQPMQAAQLTAAAALTDSDPQEAAAGAPGVEAAAVAAVAGDEASEAFPGISRPSTAASRASSRSPPRLRIPDSSAQTPPQLLSPAVSTAAATPSARTPAAAMLKNSAVSRALTVDVLSAMEAVRQSWLKEEEDKLVSFSNSGAGPGSATPAAAFGLNIAQQLAAGGSSMPSVSPLANQQLGGLLGVPGASGAVAQGASAAGSTYTSSSGSGQRYVMPAVPALRLCDVLTPVAAAAYDGSAGSSSRTGVASASGTNRSSAGGSLPGSGRGSSSGSSYRGSTTAGDYNGSEAANSSRSLLQQRSVKSILMSHPETPKRAKHVQISAEETVFAFLAEPADASSPGSMVPRPQLQLQPEQQQEQQRGSLSGSKQAEAVGGLLGSHGSHTGLLAPELCEASTQPAAAAIADVGATAGSAVTGPADVSSSGALSRGNSSSRHQREASQTAIASPRSAGSKRPDGNTQQGAAGGGDGSSLQAAKKRGSRSSKLAVQLPQLLLTDADDACAAEAATPQAGGDSEHRQVCFTPQAPEQGGKRNAILMRQLNKGKSLKHLEDMMLAVAGGELGGD